ncbi:MAG TPA: NAD-dependent epimerase/dehydratase family protein [Spirochaetia bacterium]|nr:NAD-dependent epimerase/dehydratase family protein [Spirochaetia bacterium]
MKVVVIGGTGHIGTWLVPRLLQSGHDVTCLSRGQGVPYADSGVWKEVRRISVDRGREEADGRFGDRVAALAPDAVIDLICFTRESARQIVESLQGRTGLYLSCGTIWVHGASVSVPTTESEPRRPFGQYGIDKAAMEEWLLSRARSTGFPAVVLHPGHIVGPGWVPLNPAGNFNPAVFQALARGERVALPNLGLETVHHVHADDVAQAFMRALESRGAALGECFHVVSPAALTLRGYAERISRWFGREPDLAFLPWEEWRSTASPEDAAATWDHIAHSPCCSIEKARRLLGYEPRYESLQAVCESLQWLMAKGRLSVPV